MKIKIKNQELVQELIGEIKDFPRYTTQIMNLANQNAQGTRPRVVGQLSELIQQCPEKTYEGWKRWYLAGHPDALGHATDKIIAMVDQLKQAITHIDKNLVKKWVEDLVLEKTFIGLRFQEAILKRTAKMKNASWRFASPDEESRGIDGYIGTRPVSIKPVTYKAKKALREEISTPIVYYEKTKSGLEIDMSEVLR